jgi:hypothetical protein
LVASVSTALADRHLGLKRLSGHFLIQFSQLKKNMAVWIIQVGTKLGKLKFIKKIGENRVFHTLRVCSIFRTEGSLKKFQGTHILARCEILYRMVYKTSKNKIFARTLLCVHLHVIIKVWFHLRFSCIFHISWRRLVIFYQRFPKKW